MANNTTLIDRKSLKKVILLWIIVAVNILLWKSVLFDQRKPPNEQIQIVRDSYERPLPRFPTEEESKQLTKNWVEYKTKTFTFKYPLGTSFATSYEKVDIGLSHTACEIVENASQEPNPLDWHENIVINGLRAERMHTGSGLYIEEIIVVKYNNTSFRLRANGLKFDNGIEDFSECELLFSTFKPS